MTGIVMPWPASKSSLPPTPRHRAAGKIGCRWAELHGTRSWEGLLDPLDADLRASIIAYGELAQAAYDGFNSEQRSPHAGSCLYSHAELLAASGVSHPEYYTVTKYVYASCRPGSLRLALVPPVTMAFFVLPKADLQEDPAWTGCNWMGFVAVATDEGAAALGRRDIVVAWRGSVEILEYLDDDNVWSTHAKPVLGSSAAAFDAAEVHTAFISVYLSGDESSQHCKTSARDQVVEEVRRLMEVYKDEAASITVTGHSLGAALATLNAVDMVAHGVNVSSKQGPCPVTAFLFACPRVGNESFKSAFASFDLFRALHVKNEKDIVSRLPPQADAWYVDAATTTLPISTTRSPYLGEGSKLMWHNLECYLHCVAGDHGDKGFWLEVDRDIALVNKSADALQDCYPVPANWWVIKNKCLVKSANEHFKLKDITDAIGGIHGLSG